MLCILHQQFRWWYSRISMRTSISIGIRIRACVGIGIGISISIRLVLVWLWALVLVFVLAILKPHILYSILLHISNSLTQTSRARFPRSGNPFWNHTFLYPPFITSTICWPNHIRTRHPSFGHLAWDHTFLSSTSPDPDYPGSGFIYLSHFFLKPCIPLFNPLSNRLPRETIHKHIW